MRAIRLTQDESNSIAVSDIKMILRPKKYEIQDKDFIVSPYNEKMEYSYSPGTIFIYKIFEIENDTVFDELKPFHKCERPEKFPVFGYMFRFRPFKHKVALKNDDGK